MIQDIVFEQNYAKKVDAHIKLVGEQAFMGGRQQGWNDILFILNELEAKNIDPSQEMIVKHLQQLLQQQNSTSVDEKEESNTQNEVKSSSAKKPSLSIVK